MSVRTRRGRRSSNVKTQGRLELELELEPALDAIEPPESASTSKRKPSSSFRKYSVRQFKARRNKLVTNWAICHIASSSTDNLS